MGVSERETEIKTVRSEIERLTGKLEMLQREYDNERARASEEAFKKTKFGQMTPEQQSWCMFMAYDPDNPDIPLD